MGHNFPNYCNRNLYHSGFSIFKTAVGLLRKRQLIRGPSSFEFERTLQNKYGCQKVFLTGSGRQAIHLLLQSLKTTSRKEGVLLPHYICPSVPDTILAAGLTPIFLPVQDDLSLAAEALRKDIVKSVCAIIVPHIYGYPACNSNFIVKLRQLNPDLTVIDDAASAFGVMSGRQQLGTLGDFGILSFSQGKLLNATGGGALLVFNHQMLPILERHYQKLQEADANSKIRNIFRMVWRYGNHRFSDPISYWVSKVITMTPDKTCAFTKMTNFDARLCLMGMSEIPKIHRSRSKIIAHYYNSLRNHPSIFFPHVLPTGTPPVSRLYMGYRGCRVDLRQNNDDIQSHNPLYEYLRENGVKTFYPYLPIQRFDDRYRSLWQKSNFIFSLLGLPIDYKRSTAWHSRVIDLIMKFKR